MRVPARWVKRFGLRLSDKKIDWGVRNSGGDRLDISAHVGDAPIDKAEYASLVLGLGGRRFRQAGWDVVGVESVGAVAGDPRRHFYFLRAYKGPFRISLEYSATPPATPGMAVEVRAWLGSVQPVRVGVRARQPKPPTGRRKAGG